MVSRTLLLLVLVANASFASTQISAIASESFEYPVGSLGGANGGTGWSTAWAAPGTNGSVLAPGFDPVGNKLRTDPQSPAVCFRDVDMAPWAEVTTSGKFGRNGTSVWVSFRSQRNPGVLAQFGGLSLYDGAQERLFLGSPWMTGLWGAHDHVGMGVRVILGSNVDVETHLVYRIDYRVGLDRLRIWLDPGVPFPTGPPNLDSIIGTHEWDRIRIASGAAVPNGYDFDAIGIWIETPPPGTSYCGPAVPNSTGLPGAVAGTGSASTVLNDLTLSASQLPPGQFGYLIAGQTEAFFNPPGSQGFICVTGNIARYNQIANIIQGPAGAVRIDVNAIPVNPPQTVQPGDTWNFQCWYRDANPGSTSNFTNGVSVTFF